MRDIKRMLIEANLSFLPVTSISWSHCSHLVGLGHHSVVQQRPKKALFYNQYWKQAVYELWT